MLKIAMEHLSERQRVRAELQQNIANLLVAAKANDAKVPRLCGAKVFGQIRADLQFSPPDYCASGEKGWRGRT